MYLDRVYKTKHLFSHVLAYVHHLLNINNTLHVEDEEASEEIKVKKAMFYAQ